MVRRIKTSDAIEKAVLGSLIAFQKQAVEHITKFEVEPDWFENPRNRALFEHIGKMLAENKPVDIGTLNEGFNRPLEEVKFVEDCVDACPTVAFLDGYLESMEASSRHRKLQHGLESVLRMSRAGGGPEEVVAGIHSLLDAVHQKKNRGDETVEEIARRVINTWEHPELCSGVRPRWVGLSRLIGTYPDGALIYLSARPSIGKTTLATNQAGYNVMLPNPIPTAIATLEMTRERIVKRMIGELAGISSFALDIGDGQEYLQRAKDLVDGFYGLPLYIADWSMNIDQLSAWAHIEKRRHNIKMLIVDRIELIRASKGVRQGDLFTQTTMNSSGLQQLAKDLHIPVLVITQLNRQCEIENREPELYDLRQSGSLEQDATIVLMMCRDLKDPDVTWLKVAKSQDTRTGRVPLKFQLNINRLEENMAYYKEVAVSVKDFNGIGVDGRKDKQARHTEPMLYSE